MVQGNGLCMLELVIKLNVLSPISTFVELFKYQVYFQSDSLKHNNRNMAGFLRITNLPSCTIF